MFDSMFDFKEAVRDLATLGLPFLVGIISHEVAHGYAALCFGDTTARDAGRLSANPLRHLDPAGTLFFIVTVIFPGFVFGWAKPVPVNPLRYRGDPRLAEIVVSAAGAAANLAWLVLFLLLFAAIKHTAPWPGALGEYFLSPLAAIAEAGVWVNTSLAFFNLLPIPPLDGSHILAALLPPDLARRYMALSRFGFLILILLLTTGVLRHVLAPVYTMIYSLLVNI
jgi:Zn-dependent protease